MTLTPTQRIQRARIAALRSWSKEDPKANAERAQAGLQRKFYDQTDPELPEARAAAPRDCCLPGAHVEDRVPAFEENRWSVVTGRAEPHRGNGPGPADTGPECRAPT